VLDLKTQFLLRITRSRLLKDWPFPMGKCLDLTKVLVYTLKNSGDALMTPPPLSLPFHPPNSANSVLITKKSHPRAVLGRFRTKACVLWR
jgi:hypothetical protein